MLTHSLDHICPAKTKEKIKKSCDYKNIIACVLKKAKYFEQSFYTRY